MKILDSNIFIYSSKDEYGYLRQIFAESFVYYSTATMIEVLGFHSITAKDKLYFEDVFHLLNELTISTEIKEKAIILRQTKKMSLGDAIIGASALVYGLELYTRNTQDFEWIEGLRLHSPIQRN